MKNKVAITAVLLLFLAGFAMGHTGALNESEEDLGPHHTTAAFWETDLLPVAVALIVILTLYWIRSIPAHGVTDDHGASSEV